MSASDPAAPVVGASRLITFEISGTIYALPISEVLEVVEDAGMTCVPTLPRESGGVMNWHGEALPVVAPHLLLGGGPMRSRNPGEEQQFLVLTDRPDEAACFGLPIDTVVGLVDGEPGLTRGSEVVVERRPVDGRVVTVINPRQLVARAAEVIERAAA